ncbi:MAG: ABC transporter ATP-binding protein [Planctomycetota bacterium]|nr:ABC transporter ATP-binding protein [Planctomycetota bacterium]
MSVAISHRSDWAIDLTHVDKKYRGKVHALRGIDMRVRRGEVFGLLGPNGAGKSTLVKILMTVISPSRADGTVLGRPVGHKGSLANIGYLPEHHKFPEYLTGGQVLDFYGALSGVPRAERRARAPELLELVGMTAWAKTKVKQYSKGMRQRIGIAQALMNDPELVILDEPTDGVDPVGRRDIRGMVQRLKERGKTVFLNSHLLSELEMVCDRVAILVQGKVASQGTIAELTDDQARYEIDLWLDEGQPAHDLLARALPEAANASPPPADVNALAPRVAWSGTLTTGELFRITRAGITINTTDAARVQPIIDRLRAGNVVIKSIRPVRPSLEDLFMQAVTDPNTGKAAAPGAAREKA